MSISLADITLPLWLVISQWTLLFALGFLIIVMYRQVAYLQQLKDVGSEREGLPVGEKAPAFDYIPVNGSTSAPGRFEPRGRWSLLVFADPTCASCQGTLLALERTVPKLGQTVRVLVATTAEPAQLDAVDAFRTASVDISRVNRDVPSRLYRTAVTPFGYLIDPEGKIRAKDVTTDESSLRKVLRKADRSAVNIESAVS
jgi:hypothetical protein